MHLQHSELREDSRYALYATRFCSFLASVMARFRRLLVLAPSLSSETFILTPMVEGWPLD
jgi:hypothetical protein